MTAFQLKHLRELADLRDEKGVAYWHPYGANEYSTAALLCRRGFLTGTQIQQTYELTDAGYAAARAALPGTGTGSTE